MLAAPLIAPLFCFYSVADGPSVLLLLKRMPAFRKAMRVLLAQQP